MSHHIISITRLPRDIRYGTGHFPLAAFLADPDRQRRAPIALAGNGPILYLTQPLAEAAFLDVARLPMNAFILFDELVPQIRHPDVPGITGEIYERCMAAPAVSIAVL